MTRDQIAGADEAVLRRAIRTRTGRAPVGRRTLEGLRVLAARAYGVPLDEPSVGGPADDPRAAAAGAGQGSGGAEAPILAPPETGPMALPAGTRSISEQIQVRILRDYWPRAGGRLVAGCLTRLSEAEAKPLVRDGVVEWI
ncbi:hypothetical protein [Phreatobacter stygius]|uniref:Uncharacterized protein n=1 Tax=Phreatobacter stygius TaxID=1940610 RepID=A0A4D7BI37_9HYPH|nr:hypothetical protein [Phreatobacter stygius]QCI67522.1 hypothetical protein E8M01_26840 [Phreatobacter stygius]